MPKDIKWTESLPSCDFCPGYEPGIYDGKTKMGPWANMCALHLNEYGWPLSHDLTFHRVTTSADPSV
jgi:hypothetical protein